MAKVLVIVKIMPTDIDVDLEELKDRISKALPEEYEVKNYEIEPIAFGLKALRLYIYMPEEVEGGTEPLEKAIAGVEGVSQVEVETVHRLSF
ncbi:MAG: elongation factor 1-beta [Desulfurococcales archaeon ex4484_58]|nr:MAG: elongation factor 1-beta [Desulfurococcales archaeon ex4484_58]